MIIDSSALVAVVRHEQDAFTMLDAMSGSRSARIAAPTYLEVSMVVSRWGREGRARLGRIVEQSGLTMIDFTTAHATRAVWAFDTYGRGSGHPARLDYGDCMAYAVASVEDEPLLFKGDDFTYTDIRSALPR